MLEYQVVEEAVLGSLVTSVMSLMANGFQPIGGVAVIRSDEYHYTRFYQAMIKEDQTSLFGRKMKAARRKGWTLDEAIANTVDEVLEEANAEDQD